MAIDSEPQSAQDEVIDELRRARDWGKRLPDFFIVGHAKCGTTALYRMLRAHPQIYMPDLKETQFLVREPHERAEQAKRYPRTLEQYVALFEGAAPTQRAGEASTAYLRSPITAGRIAELCPDAKIIAILREPAEFLRSFHLQLLQAHIETEPDLAKAIALEEKRRTAMGGERPSIWRHSLLYSEHVRYAEQLRRYHEHFGRARVLVLIYDDLRRDNEGAAREVLRFLEVDDTVALEATEANPTVRVRSQRAQKLVRAISVGQGPASRTVKRTLKAVTSQRLRRRAMETAKRVTVDTKPRAPAEAVMSDLRRRFKGEVVAAGDYLDRDLVSLWGYEDVA
jgi:Sulfotransferase family